MADLLKEIELRNSDQRAQRRSSTELAGSFWRRHEILARTCFKENTLQAMRLQHSKFTMPELTTNNVIAFNCRLAKILPMNPVVGDKVRVKSTKERGVVESLDGCQIQVRLETGSLISFSELEITNYSMAARKAWENMPNRRVGRPKGTSTTDRVSVTLRIDRELWEAFKSAEERGVVVDRTATINQWISEKLHELDN